MALVSADDKHGKSDMGERNPSEWMSQDPKDLGLEVAEPKSAASGV